MLASHGWPRRPFLIALLALICIATMTAQGFGFDRLSPFTMLRWQGETPEVQVQGKWYRLLAIDGLGTDKVLGYCKKTYEHQWDKRFCEDLVEVLHGMGHPPGSTVSLTVANLEGKKRRLLKNVPMTEENRNRIRDARPRAGQKKRSSDLKRVERKHRKKPLVGFEFLTTRYWEGQDGLAILSAEYAQNDLDQLEWHIQNEFSYRDLKGVDYKGALDTIRLALGDGISFHDFNIQLRKFMALFGDGHSRVRGVQQMLRGGFCPFPVADVGGRLVALAPGGNGLLDADHPFIASIDGIPIARWVSAAEQYCAAGSPQFVRLEVVYHYFHRLGHLRWDVGVPPGTRLRVEFESGDGKSRVTRELELADRPHRYPSRFPRDHEILDGNVGYLRVPEMSSDAVRSIDELQKMQDTNGLIIDVRHNGGGSREFLRALYPCLQAGNEAPRVVNVGAYRMPPGTQRGAPNGYLWNRFLFPEEYHRWAQAEREAVARVAATFRPEWHPQRREFSRWHFMVAGSGDAPFRYTKPVVILMDGGCFSATDIFLGAFQDHPRVTLLGTKSGGGSGRSLPVVLFHSGARLKLSSMASFLPDGSLYDGRGITPDVVVEPTLDDILGRTDTQLEAALERLR